MKRKHFFIGILLVFALAVSACGGGSGDELVAMETVETGVFTIDVPTEWATDSAFLRGMTVFVASSAELDAKSFADAADPAAMFGDAPGVLIMNVPSALIEAGTYTGFSADELRNLADAEPDVEFVTQGDFTIDDVKGFQLVGKGDFEAMGAQDTGIHITVLEREEGLFVLMGFSSSKDVDKNLDIFKNMAESVIFKVLGGTHLD